MLSSKLNTCDTSERYLKLFINSKKYILCLDHHIIKYEIVNMAYVYLYQ